MTISMMFLPNHFESDEVLCIVHFEQVIVIRLDLQCLDLCFGQTFGMVAATNFLVIPESLWPEPEP